MNYRLFLAGNGGNIEDKLLGTYFRDPWQRPTVGQHIKVKGKVWRVMRSDPFNNPDNTTVDYYLEPLNENAPYKAKR